MKTAPSRMFFMWRKLSAQYLYSCMLIYCIAYYPVSRILHVNDVVYKLLPNILCFELLSWHWVLYFFYLVLHAFIQYRAWASYQYGTVFDRAIYVVTTMLVLYGLLFKADGYQESVVVDKNLDYTSLTTRFNVLKLASCDSRLIEHPTLDFA